MPRRTLTGKVPKQRSNPYVEHNCFPLDGSIRCFCDQFPRLKARLRTCQTNRNGNRGRKFWSCANPDEYCDFFIWQDELEDKGYNGPALLYGYGGDNDDDGYGLGDRYLEEEAGLYFDECYEGGGAAQLRTPPGSNQNSPQKKKKSGGDGNKKVNSASKKRKLQDQDDDDDVQVVGSSSSQQKKKKKKPIRLHNSTAARSPSSSSSSESPSPSPRPSSSSSSAHKLQTELARLRAELEREKADKNKFKNELDELRDENSQMLEQLFPGPFS
ncbi:hypothetical protein C6P46_003332 [Rhodotorula mucilaginosa]|uniref:GRF-type domain-containing protein n=1 Tax=Rhodotorula mucilaginosa TaxID=5537 RepID=A0A9P6W326_RHOMI|nr:hypothetical protein C6P46_003332 [Rhodotorula mucilaginosa]